MRIFFALAAVTAVFLAMPASAEVASSSPTSLEIRAAAETTASPDRTWRAVAQIGHWWGSDHTYSGNSANMRLDPRAGGCWCERWAGGQVEHMHVVLAMNADGTRMLRLVGALGPLQEMTVNGVMTFTIEAHGTGSRLRMTYRVAGEAGVPLNEIAPGVDHVLMEQFEHLIRYTGAG